MQNTKRFFSAISLLLVLLSASAAFGAAGVVNINTADAETLQNLPRVGPAVAERIVEFRQANGQFASKTDLLLVKGIGSKTYDLIEPYVTLEGDSTLAEKVRAPRRESEGSAR